MQPRKFNRSLPVKMAGPDQAAAALELVALVNSLRELKTQKKQVHTAWRERIKDAEGKVSHAAEMVTKGLKSELVEVEERYDTEAGEATIVRLDTGEIAEVRPMTADELEAARQLDLPEAD